MLEPLGITVKTAGWKNFIGTLCELIVFNKALTDSTNPPINGLLQGLADKWGVTL